MEERKMWTGSWLAGKRKVSSTRELSDDAPQDLRFISIPVIRGKLQPIWAGFCVHNGV